MFERAQTGRMQKAKATQDASKRNVKVVMDVRCVPPTYSNFVMLRALAKKLCWEKEYMQAFHQLEHAAYVLQMINLQCDEEDVLYGSKAADVLDDMACIMQLQCDYGRAHRYLMVRLQTLTGFDDPLLAGCPGGQVLVRITPTHVFPNCPRYIPKTELIAPSDYVPQANCAPPEPAWKSSVDFKDVVPPRKPTV